jgi:aerobic-type carbon monoxide dehydrogenase small subunit (CoxS/CutS family)
MPAADAPIERTPVITFQLDGHDAAVPDDGGSLLDALREHLGCRTVKDGCSPQGQCGCCTVLVDGAPRVSCVTPIRRVAGRSVTTVDGLEPRVRRRWADAMVDAGASQCGFCTPGIVLRLAALEERFEERFEEPDGSRSVRPVRPVEEVGAAVRSALLAHLCRCTGWQTIVEAAGDVVGRASRRESTRDPLRCQWRAQVEGPDYQVSGADVVLGGGRFADDTAPPGALVAVPDADGNLVTGTTAGAARRRAGKVQGRRSTVALDHPLEVPDGDWSLTLRTTWVEPAYLEPDASWCEPGGTPATPLANGGAFGGKRRSPVPAAARRLADDLGQAVRVLWSREDVVRWGPKRPPVAAGIREDGTGVLVLARGTGGPAGVDRWDADADGDGPDGRPGPVGWPDADLFAARVGAVAPGLVVDHRAVPGPPTSADIRGAGWVEAAVLVAALDARREGRTGHDATAEVVAPGGGRARVAVGPDGRVSVEVWAGEVLDEVTLRSYCIGAVHQALGWVWSEGIAVDADGRVHDLTVRSFGILSARDMPPVEVKIDRSDSWPVNGSDAVFAATAAAAWLADGLAPEWPTRRTSGTATRVTEPA